MASAAWRVGLAGLLFALTTCPEAMAAYVGDYFFPSTLATTVPTPADFLNPPNFVRLPTSAATPSTSEVDVPTTYSKLITPDWSVTATETLRILEQANRTRAGFDNLLLGTQYQLYTDAEHQFVFTIGGTATIGGTGSASLGTASANISTGSPNVGPESPSVVAAPFSTFTPTVYVGKGFGDLPDSMAAFRPIAVTSQVGVALPTQSKTFTTVTLPTGATAGIETFNPNILQWGFALEYSQVTTSYSDGERKGSRFAHGWVPLVEFALQTPLEGPLAGTTTGTINPGAVFVTQYFQFAMEAIIPINERSGRDIGARAQVHLYLSELFPDTIGKPIFDK